MSVYTIPTSGDAYSIQRTDLEGTEYIFQLDWSTRESCWYMSIYDNTFVSLASGIKLVCNWPLTYRLPNPLLPPGHFMVTTRTASDDSPPLQADLAPGGRCQLTYVSSDTVAAGP